jgi:hypothetical protein
LQNKDYVPEIKKILIALGVMPTMLGFHCLTIAVSETISDPMLLHAILKRLYPLVAGRMRELGFLSFTDSKVERAMRHAVNKILERHTYNDIRIALGLRGLGLIDKLTSSKFIALLADAAVLRDE